MLEDHPSSLPPRAISPRHKHPPAKGGGEGKTGSSSGSPRNEAEETVLVGKVTLKDCARLTWSVVGGFGGCACRP